MCNDPNHVTEFKEISSAVIRMETKIDNILSVTMDHEARLRATETSLILQKDIERDHAESSARIASIEKRLRPLEAIADDNSKTLGALKRVLWAIVLAIASAIGLLIVDLVRGGR